MLVVLTQYKKVVAKLSIKKHDLNMDGWFGRLTWNLFFAVLGVESRGPLSLSYTPAPFFFFFFKFWERVSQSCPGWVQTVAISALAS